MINFKKQLIREGVFALVAVIIFSAFLTLFNLNIKNQVGIINSFKSQRSVLSRSISELSLLIKDWETARNYKDKVAQLVPQKDSLVLVPNELKNLAKSSGLVLGFSFGPETNVQREGDLGSISFTASVEGPIESIANFFSDMESRYYSIKIESFDLSKSIQDKNVRVMFKGSFYFY